MPASDRDPFDDMTFSNRRSKAPQTDPMSGTSGARALWSAIAVLAIVTVLFVAFYDINASRDHAQATVSGPAVTTAPQTTGQGGSQNDGVR